MVPLTEAEVLENGAALRLRWADSSEGCFHAIWLRDNALDRATRDPDNGQRLITILDIPAETRIGQAAIDTAGDLALRFAPEGKSVAFPSAWLRARRYDAQEARPRGWTGPDVVRWGAELAGAIPTVSYDAARRDRAALAGWLAAIRRSGFAVMTALPAEPGQVCKAAELFGHVRETNYGRWFEVRAEINPVNLAYTGLGLQVHSDNPYRDPVPTLQLLACLESSAEGGDSIVVDGFKAIDVLRQEMPGHFDLLADHCARFEYSGSGDVCLSARRPMIELAPDGELIALRFNNRSAAPLREVPYNLVPAYYAAYRHLAEIMERPALRVRFKLAAGELFIVDNTRVLHGREAFSGTGTRWLQGCYADKDGLLSTLAVLERAPPGIQKAAKGREAAE
jgi:gamma-butyrobetaine dioxygenase